MAYNKVKLVDSAQKYLNQGKVSQAIAEYQQVLRHEPKDQVTLMTIGDLFVRQGDTFQALEYFERLAQLFLSDGFVAKAIAIYKKIAKLAPEETKPLEKLAELYVQQGVMSEARPIYLQLAEVHLKANRHQQAVALLRKLLEAEPENLRVQIRLGELYHTMGQQTEAAGVFLTAAQRQLERHQHSEAEKLADRALKLDPNHTAAVTLKARAMAAAGKRADAATLLETLPDLDAGSEATALLIEQNLQGGETKRAATLARKVFERNAKNYELAFNVASALLDAGELDASLELLGLVREAMAEAGDQDRLAQSLTAATERAQGRLEPLEWLVDLYARTSDSFRLPDALGQLADAAAAVGQLDRAKRTYEQLLEREPEDEAARRGLNRVRTRMGLEPLELIRIPTLSAETRPEGKPKLEHQRRAVAVAEPELDEETQAFLSQAHTDVDLFSSYGLTQKAVDLLETMLQRVPRHTPTLEKLLDLNLGAGNDRRTAELAAQLEQIYGERRDSSNAERFSELRRRFQRAAGLAPKDAAAAMQSTQPIEFTVPRVQAEAVPTVESVPAAGAEAVPVGESAVHEVDLSEEWAALSQQVEEAMHISLEPTESVESPAHTQPVADFPQTPPAPESPSPGRGEATSGARPQASAEATAEPVPPSQAEPAAEYELELTPLDQPQQSTEQPGWPAGVTDAAAPMSSAQFLSELASEFEGLSAGLTVPAHVGPDIETTSTAAPQGGSHSASPQPEGSAPQQDLDSKYLEGPESPEPLREVFDEFRAELGEMSADKEDLETHYNLGIAYREMGLLDEAIGEFQKVAKATDNGQAFRYAMQCCTLLGLAFMEKGEPNIASMWYERALQTPGLDQESILALRYDLGVAQELAGDEAAALKSFSKVYAMNIDYRDVAERISTLGKRR